MKTTNNNARNTNAQIDRAIDASDWLESAEYAAPISDFVEALEAYADAMADCDCFTYGNA